MLHAAHLGIEHPVTGKRMTWDAALPKDMKDLLARLRAVRSKAVDSRGEKREGSSEESGT
jgi:hypothetical protein